MRDYKLRKKVFNEYPNKEEVAEMIEAGGSSGGVSVINSGSTGNVLTYVDDTTAYWGPGTIRLNFTKEYVDIGEGMKQYWICRNSTMSKCLEALSMVNGNIYAGFGESYPRTYACLSEVYDDSGTKGLVFVGVQFDDKFHLNGYDVHEYTVNGQTMLVVIGDGTANVEFASGGNS